MKIKQEHRDEMNNKVFFKPNPDGKTYKYAFVHFEEDISFLATSESYDDSPIIKYLEGVESKSHEAEKILIEIENDIYSSNVETRSSKKPWKHCLNGGIPPKFHELIYKY